MADQIQRNPLRPSTLEIGENKQYPNHTLTGQVSPLQRSD